MTESEEDWRDGWGPIADTPSNREMFGRLMAQAIDDAADGVSEGKEATEYDLQRREIGPWFGVVEDVAGYGETESDDG